MTDRFVYVMSHEDGSHKIGLSGNPAVRRYFVAMDTGGKRVDLLYQFQHPHAAQVERLAHRLLADYALGREWFRISLAKARAAIWKAARLIDSGSHVPKALRRAQRPKRRETTPEEWKAMADAANAWCEAHPEVVAEWERQSAERQSRWRQLQEQEDAEKAIAIAEATKHRRKK